jgi:hypothetical protein
MLVSTAAQMIATISSAPEFTQDTVLFSGTFRYNLDPFNALNSPPLPLKSPPLPLKSPPLPLDSPRLPLNSLPGETMLGGCNM